MSAVAKALMTSSNWKAGSLVEIPFPEGGWVFGSEKNLFLATGLKTKNMSMLVLL